MSSQSSGTAALEATDGDGASTDRTELTSDEIFQLLTNTRRRRALRVLYDLEETTDLGTLADEVAAMEMETPVAEVSSDERQRVYISLYQSHLPALAEADVVDYDSESGRIELGPNFDQLVSYLQLSDSPDSSTSRGWLGYYLLAGCLGIVFWSVHFFHLLRISPLFLHAGSTVSTVTVAIGHLVSRVRDLLSQQSQAH
ncbi:DUF7344 domain-containing protein [Haloarchaeobius sp. TZWSO28]|uniref:DUF7344 domain-containing protein n=1 Tax=Haloarchaeobius sp. TZWSO28 TaxID=3446119 RepID=UPI003EBF1EAA